MRKFNPEKELYKIQYGKRNKIIVGVISLLVISLISVSFALYEVSNKHELIYSTVGEFASKDIILAVYKDNELADDFPTKDDDYVYDRIVCENNKDNHIKAYWNSDTWNLELKTNNKAKCDIYFAKSVEYQDKSGANPPELYQGMIPIYYEEDGTMKTADVNTEWYNYDKHKWANAILIDHNDTTVMNKFYNEGKLNTGITVEESDILQMYVWIPRYKYQLFNVSRGSSLEQMINIKFEHGVESSGDAECQIESNGSEICQNILNGNWYTHPAFTFGNTELRGIWVGKFEPSHTTKSQGSTTTDSKSVLNCNDNNCEEAENIRIIPNKPSLRYNNISNFFYVSLSLTKADNKYNLNRNEVDTHMMKNSEWGAVAYLSHSRYGNCNNNVCTEIWFNCNNAYKTGCAGDSLNAAFSSKCNQWRSTNGVKASTTGNIYGIYDMNGGAYEFVMGNMVTNATPGLLNANNSGFVTPFPNLAYYDAYVYGTTSDDQTAYNRSHFGDATGETRGWMGDGSNIPDSTSEKMWLSRGGRASFSDAVKSGIFNSANTNGESYVWRSSRITLISYSS